MEYIKSMTGIIQKARGYGQHGLELKVTVSFDSKEFNKIKRKKQCPLKAGMAQIKNVVLDSTGVRGLPSYSPVSYSQRFPRASKGLITLDLYFDISNYNASQLGADITDYFLNHKVDLNTTLKNTRNDGHLFAKSAIASTIAN